MRTSYETPIISRKEFIHIGLNIGGVAVLSAFLNACSGNKSSQETILENTSSNTTSAPASTVAPSATIQPEQTTPVQPTRTIESTKIQPGDTTQVALVWTNNRSQGVKTAIELMDINQFQEKRVFLKPNFNSSDPTPGSTHPDVLRALVLLLQELGAIGITVGDRSGMGDTNTVMHNLGVYQMAEEYRFDTLVLNDLPMKDWVEFQPSGSHWKQGFLVARPCLETDSLIQTCCLKTHAFGGIFTMSLKNTVGMVAKRHPSTGYDYMQELHSSQHQTAMIAEINAAYTPNLIIMDGVEAFISGGPAQGEKVAPGIVLAGTDRIAMDAVGVAVLKMFGAYLPGPIFEQKQIARAVELKLGVDNPEKINFITGDTESATFANQIRQILLSKE